jgi:hypothetical protein
VAASLGSKRPLPRGEQLGGESGGRDRRALSLLLLPVLIVTGALAVQTRLPTGDGRVAAAPVVVSSRIKSNVGDTGPLTPSRLSAEIPGTTLDLAWLPRAPADEIGVASLDLGLLPAAPGPEATVPVIALGHLPSPLRYEVATAVLELDRLPDRPPEEVSAVTLDLTTLPLPIRPETTVATVDLDMIEPSRLPGAVTGAPHATPLPKAETPRVGYLMGPRPRLWPDRQPPLARLPRTPGTDRPSVLAPVVVAAIDTSIVEPARPAAARATTGPVERCAINPSIAERLVGGAPAVPLVAPPAPGVFGEALADAAIRQTREFGIYDARYMRIGYPRGDVPGLYGACTDLVIRAFRAVAVDSPRARHRR